MFDPFDKGMAHCVNQLSVVLLKESCNQVDVRQARGFHTEPITALLTHSPVDRSYNSLFHLRDCFTRAHITKIHGM